MKAKLELEFQNFSELREYLGQTLGECKCHQAAQATGEPEFTTMPEPQLGEMPTTNPPQFRPAEAVPQAMPAPAPVVHTPAPVAPAPTPEPTPEPAPVAVAEPAYTQAQIARAGAELVDMGKQPELPGLMARFGISSLADLAPDKYNEFAVALREMGARI